MGQPVETKAGVNVFCLAVGTYRNVFFGQVYIVIGVVLLLWAAVDLIQPVRRVVNPVLELIPHRRQVSGWFELVAGLTLIVGGMLS